MSLVEERQTHPPRSASLPKPKGILKNAPSIVTHNLQWDEENLALTEIQKDSLMKITEPKTPYVRYNAETDEIEGDIPNLDLGRRASSPQDEHGPVSPVMSVSSTGADASSPSSRRTSFSSNGRPGTSMSQRSRSSSRSTSFNLPSDARTGITRRLSADDLEIEDDPLMDEEAAKKHAEFLRARGRHYSNEAEAMKRAAQLMNEDEEEAPPLPELPSETSDYTSGDDISDEGMVNAPKINGTLASHKTF